MCDTTRMEKDSSSQIDELAKYIMREYPNEIKDGGAVNVAIQIMSKQKKMMIAFAADCAYSVLNSESKMDIPSIYYERVENRLKNWQY